MNVSVIICVVNTPVLLGKTLKSILKNTILPFEILVIHQGFDDEINKIIHELNLSSSIIQYVKDSGFGLSRARNRGIALAKGEIIAFTDDDAYIHEEWIENIITTFNQGESIGIVGGKIIPVYEQKNVSWKIPDNLQFILPSYDQGEILAPYPPGITPPGVNFSIKRDILLTVGGFNEKLGFNMKRKMQLTGEDTDMALRVKEAGFQIIYCPKCIVYHPVLLERQNLTYLKRRMFIEGVTETYLYLLHNKPSLRYKVNLLKYRIIELINLRFKSSDNNWYEATKSRVFGCIYSVIVNGLFAQI